MANTCTQGSQTDRITLKNNGSDFLERYIQKKNERSTESFFYQKKCEIAGNHDSVVDCIEEKQRGITDDVKLKSDAMKLDWTYLLRMAKKNNDDEEILIGGNSSKKTEIFHERTISRNFETGIGQVFWICCKGWRFPLNVQISEKRQISEIYISSKIENPKKDNCEKIEKRHKFDINY